MEEVINHISKAIDEVEKKKLLKQFSFKEDADLNEKLQHIPWQDIKRALELIDRYDIVEHIQKNTLITKGTMISHLTEIQL